MSNFVFANNVNTTLSGSISSTATTITLASTANFPTIPVGYMWAVTLNDQATQTLFEIVYATVISGNNLTVLRGQEGTAARAWNVGDYTFAADTAGILASFASESQLSNYAQLNPSSQQSGSLNISGSIDTGGAGNFTGVSVGGALNNATTGNFSNDLFSLAFISSLPYSSTSIPNLPFRFNGADTIGMGASSVLSLMGVTGGALVVGSSVTGVLLTLDTNGFLAVAGNVYGQSGKFTSEVLAPEIVQNGTQVVSTLSSSSLALTRSGSNYEIETIAPTQLPIGASFVGDGNGGNPTIGLPAYGQWFIELFYAIQETSNTNMDLTLSLTGGTITGGLLSNANGHTSFNAVAWIMIYGKGHTTINNQTLTFGLAISNGTLDPSNQPWTVRATRTA